MPKDAKLIGVCLSQAYSYINAGYIAELERAASREGYRVVVFNTALDFYWFQQGNAIARSIYHAIHYDQFSALVFVHESFQDRQLQDQIIRQAGERGVPVFCLGAVREGCISILYDYYEPYKELLRHVIREHGVRDPFFISGIVEEANSVLRIQCFREVLQEEGLPWKRENVAYGYFIESPTRKIVEDLIREREKMPDAIFCANDYMAITVCETLRKHGIRVPEEVRVTGFDGIPLADLCSPRLTSCSQDAPALAEKTMGLILALSRGEKVDPVQHHVYRPVLSESCGCPAPERPQMDALTLFRRMEEQESQENHLYYTIQHMLLRDNMRDVLLTLSWALPERAAVYLNESFLTSEQSAEYDLDRLEPVLLKISHQNREEGELKIQRVLRENLALESAEGEGTTIFTSIHSEKMVVGCFAVHTVSLAEDHQVLKRLGDVLNLAFTVLLGNVRQRRLLTHLENSLYQDPLTEMPNMKGLGRWFEDYTAQTQHRDRAIAVSVYDIYRYEYLYDNYGISETEEIVCLVGRWLREANPEALCVARISERQFAVANDAASGTELGEIIRRCVRAFFREMEKFNLRGGKSFLLEVNCGCTTMNPGWKNATLGNLIQLATGEMYLNRLNAEPHEAEKKDVQPDQELYRRLNLLLNKNLFQYHFQPIVDARTGQIYAYEALMRTDAAINLEPMEILNLAKEYNHLYDVERETLFGIMERFTQNYGAFHNNKVFINTIPGYFLRGEDLAELRSRFEQYLDCFVFELTEQDAITDEELERLKQLHKAGSGTQIAVDDFGTGHSNIVNLLRYMPQIIKIDRGLISGIAQDRNKQLFVRNTIEFAHQNGIQALAEGVETSEELRCVIEYGVDLVQGFYTARPAAQPVAAIPESVRAEIRQANLRRKQQDGKQRIYQARSGEKIHLIPLALQNYSVVQIPSGEVTLIGETDHAVDITLRVEEDARARVTLDHVSLHGAVSAPILIGKGASLILHLLGKSVLYKEGIHVPPSARLRIEGRGDLEVRNTRNYAPGIGASFQDPYGTIELEMEGTLTLHANGDKVVCIGGGSSGGEGIWIRRARIQAEATGVNVIGIGSASGPAKVLVDENAELTMTLSGNDAVALGTMSGEADLRLLGRSDILVQSERAVGIGSMSGTAACTLEKGETRAVVRCDVGSCMGSFTGHARLLLAGGRTEIHGEGNRVCGLGSVQGSCETEISGGEISGDLLAGIRMILGNDRSRCRVTGGTIHLAEAEELIRAARTGREER